VYVLCIDGGNTRSIDDGIVLRKEGGESNKAVSRVRVRGEQEADVTREEADRWRRRSELNLAEEACGEFTPEPLQGDFRRRSPSLCLPLSLPVPYIMNIINLCGAVRAGSRSLGGGWTEID